MLIYFISDFSSYNSYDQSFTRVKGSLFWKYFRDIGYVTSAVLSLLAKILLPAAMGTDKDCAALTYM